jgi:hypothetical protein
MDARSALRSARVKVVEADERLAVVKDTREAAQAFAGKVAREVEGFAAIDHEIACDRADAIRRALTSGAIPMFEALPAVSANAAQMAEAQNRLEACRLALGEIETDQRNAEAALSTAKDSERAAIVAVMIGEAVSIAERIEALEGEARALRVQLGGPFGVVGGLPGLPDVVARVITSTADNMTEVMLRTPGLEQAGRRAARVWAVFASLLESDSEAALDFDGSAADEARAARKAFAGF